MNILHRLLLAAALIAAVSSLAAGFTVRPYQPPAAMEEIQAAMDTATSMQSRFDVARMFRDRYPDDAVTQMSIANILITENYDAVREYYVTRAANENDNPVAQYLAGRLMTAAGPREVYADRILELDPDNYWGLILKAGVVSSNETPGFAEGERLLRRAIEINNSLPFAVEELGKLLARQGKNDEAGEVFTKLLDMQPSRLAAVQYRIALDPANHERTLRLVEEFLTKNPDNAEALYLKGGAARELEKWNLYVESMRRMAAIDPTFVNVYDLACAFSLAGSADSAFNRLFQSVDLGLTDIEQFRDDEDLIPLRDDPRWSELLTYTEEADQRQFTEALRKAEETRDQRHEEALKTRGNKTAPAFALKDFNDKVVTLDSLRGKVVILDFWATWCGPCRKTMPLLDQFYTGSKPEDVEVFAVNIWEKKGIEGVKPYIEKHGYHFPVLYGSNQTAADYGVRGIPTMVIIDKKGNVAYRHTGYSPTIVETLVWQTTELLKAE